MLHQNLEQLQKSGGLSGALPLDRREKLSRWAEALERCGSEPLKTLWRSEFAARPDRMLMRADRSPLSVAYDDPVLRAAGLAGDTYGAAKEFFELPERKLHWLVCFCHHGATIPANLAATYVRSLANARRGWFARLFG